LTEVLQAAQRNGEANFDDSATAANHFVAMVRGNLHLQVVLALKPHPPATKIFLRAPTAPRVRGPTAPLSSAEQFDRLDPGEYYTWIGSPGSKREVYIGDEVVPPFSGNVEVLIQIRLP
jgi:hypothetical protein